MALDRILGMKAFEFDMRSLSKFSFPRMLTKLNDVQCRARLWLPGMFTAED